VDLPDRGGLEADEGVEAGEPASVEVRVVDEPCREREQWKRQDGDGEEGRATPARLQSHGHDVCPHGGGGEALVQLSDDLS
jgi:hypothetical protein